MTSQIDRKLISTAKGLGILFVVAGHIPNEINFFPFMPYTFHIPLFYFLSGLVFNPTYLVRPGAFVQSRLRSLLLPYFIYNFLFALITEGNSRWLGVTFSPNRWNDPWMLFVEPFISGHQFFLFLPGWFLCSLFLVGIAYLLLTCLFKRFAVREVFRFMLFLTFALAGMKYGKIDPATDHFNNYLNLVVAKNLPGLFFFYLGTRFRDETTIARLCDSRIFLAACLIQVYFVTHSDANFFVAWNKYPSIPSSLITSLCGITLIIFVGSLLVRSERANIGWLISIGDHSIHILSLHLFVFFILNITLLSWHGESLNILSSQKFYMYDAKHLWPIYLVTGVGLPTAFALLGKRLRIVTT